MSGRIPSTSSLLGLIGVWGGCVGAASCGDQRTELIAAPDPIIKPRSADGGGASDANKPGRKDAGLVGRTPCETSADCTGEDDRLCHPSAGYCVECVTDGHCDEVGERCSSLLGECSVPCETDNDCMDDDALCDAVIGYCVECLVDDDCRSGWLCRRSDCVSP